MFLPSLDCELKTTQLKRIHGEQLIIKLPIWYKKLEFSSVKEKQSVLWPSCAQHTRKYVKESGYKRQFIINPVTYNDQGTYTRWNYRNQVSSVFKLEVFSKWLTMPLFNLVIIFGPFTVLCTVFFFLSTLILPPLITLKAATHIKDCEAGKTFTISLDGLAKEDVTLLFTNEDSNITLVEHGLPVNNSHNHFSERIQVTSSDIQVLNIGVSDMGNYTLTDHEGRKVKVITPHFVCKFQ